MLYSDVINYHWIWGDNLSIYCKLLSWLSLWCLITVTLSNTYYTLSDVVIFRYSTVQYSPSTVQSQYRPKHVQAAGLGRGFAYEPPSINLANAVPNFSMMCDLLLLSLKKTRFVVTVFGHGKKWPAILAVEFGRPLIQQIPCQEKLFNFWTSARINRAFLPDFLFGTVFAEGKSGWNEPKWLKWANFDLPKWQSGLKKWLKWANFEKRYVIFFQKWIIFTYQKS